MRPFARFMNAGVGSPGRTELRGPGVLHKADLDRILDADPSITEAQGMRIRSGCCKAIGNVFYRKEGRLVFFCSACGKFFMSVAVAE